MVADKCRWKFLKILVTKHEALVERLFPWLSIPSTAVSDQTSLHDAVALGGVAGRDRACAYSASGTYPLYSSDLIVGATLAISHAG